MKICVPTNDDRGLESAVCSHFGSAPFLMIVDTEGGVCRAIPNAHQHDQHGMCVPLAALQGEGIDGMAVGGIGPGALNKLVAAGIQVFLSETSTVDETVHAYETGTLRRVTLETSCAHHRERGGH